MHLYWFQQHKFQLCPGDHAPGPLEIDSAPPLLQSLWGPYLLYKVSPEGIKWELNWLFFALEKWDTEALSEGTWNFKTFSHFEWSLFLLFDVNTFSFLKMKTFFTFQSGKFFTFQSQLTFSLLKSKLFSNFFAFVVSKSKSFHF